eukprot:gnl/MRDRNA2_/MRDRNA2_14872_c0_seq1.p1 gnl/MRDRNA2_/MRDRNA2_14872_c0~~gnl/MRDRNA2_/MRDRNA2_14872_c0_seq1.p1  ORF type:complete len:326 (+),score=49.78 gnl/MRDRNA2_/MRDRNA2_14872_c0_seq1:92-1069(+)
MVEPYREDFRNPRFVRRDYFYNHFTAFKIYNDTNETVTVYWKAYNMPQQNPDDIPGRYEQYTLKPGEQAEQDFCMFDFLCDHEVCVRYKLPKDHAYYEDWKAKKGPDHEEWTLEACAWTFPSRIWDVSYVTTAHYPYDLPMIPWDDRPFMNEQKDEWPIEGMNPFWDYPEEWFQAVKDRRSKKGTEFKGPSTDELAMGLLREEMAALGITEAPPREQNPFQRILPPLSSLQGVVQQRPGEFHSTTPDPPREKPPIRGMPPWSHYYGDDENDNDKPDLYETEYHLKSAPFVLCLASIALVLVIPKKFNKLWKPMPVQELVEPLMIY